MRHELMFYMKAKHYTHQSLLNGKGPKIK